MNLTFYLLIESLQGQCKPFTHKQSVCEVWATLGQGGGVGERNYTMDK